MLGRLGQDRRQGGPLLRLEPDRSGLWTVRPRAGVSGSCWWWSRHRATPIPAIHLTVASDPAGCRYAAPRQPRRRARSVRLGRTRHLRQTGRRGPRRHPRSRRATPIRRSARPRKWLAIARPTIRESGSSRHDRSDADQPERVTVWRQWRRWASSATMKTARSARAISWPRRSPEELANQSPLPAASVSATGWTST